MTDSLASFIEQPHFSADQHAYDAIWPPAFLPSTILFAKQVPVTVATSLSMPAKSPFSFAPFGVAGSSNTPRPSIQPSVSMSFGFNNNHNTITNQITSSPSTPFNPLSMVSNTSINQLVTPKTSAMSLQSALATQVPAATAVATTAVSPLPVKVKREPPPIKEIAQEIVDGIMEQQLANLLTSVWTQCKEEARKEDRAIRQRAAQDITLELMQQLLQNILTETISNVRRQVDITRIITRTSHEMVHEFLDKALLTTIAKLVAEKRVKASLYRWTIQRWRAAYQAREARRIERQRRIEQFRLDTSGIKLGPVRCDQLSLPLTEFHVIRDTASTPQTTTPVTETEFEDPWQPIDWSKQLALLKLPDSNHHHIGRQSCFWRLSVSVEEEDTLSIEWLEAKTLIESSSNEADTKGITYLVPSSTTTMANKSMHKVHW
jgi:hypothetical protein